MPKYSLTFTASPDDAKAMLDLAVKALTAQELNELHFSKIENGDDTVPVAHTRATPAHRKFHKPGTNGPEALFAHIKSVSKISRERARTWLHAQGYSATSIGPFTSKLKKLGLIEFNRPNYYITQAGKDFSGPISGSHK